MNTHLLLVGSLLVLAALSGCLDDPTPDTVRLRVEGPAGGQVQLMLSQNFVAGRNEDTGGTEVRVFLADTVVRTVPIDTVISIVPDRIFFTQAAPSSADTLTVRIRVDADARNLFDSSGDIYADDPWRFVYVFNVRLATSNISVVF